MRSPRAASRVRGVALVCLLAWVAGCSKPPEESPAPEIRVGVLAVLGELWPGSGRPTIEAARLVAAEVNEAGGIDVGGVSHRVTVVLRSHEDRADAAAGSARSLINQEYVVAIVGPQLSRHAIPVAMVAESARVPMITPMSSNPQTTAGKHYVFRLAFMDDAQGAALALFAREELGAERAAVLFDVARAYSRDLTAVFTTQFTRDGGKVVALEEFTSDAPVDYREALARIHAKDPDVLLLPNFTAQDSVQLRQARELGMRAQILGGDTWDLRSIPSVPGAEGAYVTHQWNAAFPTPEAERFIRRYMAAYGDTPRTTAAMTYDAFWVLMRAIEEVDSLEPDDIRRGIAGMTDFHGVTGQVSFNGTGDPTRSVTLSRIVGGKIQFHSVRDPEL